MELSPPESKTVIGRALLFYRPLKGRSPKDLPGAEQRNAANQQPTNASSIKAAAAVQALAVFNRAKVIRTAASTTSGA
jgi:hypothetical protein